jgi:Fe-S-cluster formation regulator IscX/YfhJ
MKVWQWLQAAYPRLLAFHVPNESDAPVQYRVKMKRKGLVPGVADFFVFPDCGRKIAIELKDADNDQDPEQVKFQLRWQRTGGVYFICRTLEEFQGVINALMLFA